MDTQCDVSSILAYCVFLFLWGGVMVGISYHFNNYSPVAVADDVAWKLLNESFDPKLSDSDGDISTDEFVIDDIEQKKESSNNHLADLINELIGQTVPESTNTPQ